MDKKICKCKYNRILLPLEDKRFYIKLKKQM